MKKKTYHLIGMILTGIPIIICGKLLIDVIDVEDSLPLIFMGLMGILILSGIFLMQWQRYEEEKEFQKAYKGEKNDSPNVIKRS